MSLRGTTNILIVGKNQDFIQLVEPLLIEIGCRQIYAANSLSKGVEMLGRYPCDVCVLDVSPQDDQRVDRHTAETIRRLRPHMPLILVCANCTEEAYLQFRHLKPSSFLGMDICRLTLLEAIDRAILQLGKTLTMTPETLNSPACNEARPCFFRTFEVYQAFPMQDVQYFYASEKLTYVKVAKQLYPTNTHLKILEKVLHNNFIRIHKTYLINIHHIESIHTSENNVMIDGQKLPIGNSYRKSFLKRLPLL